MGSAGRSSVGNETGRNQESSLGERSCSTTINLPIYDLNKSPRYANALNAAARRRLMLGALTS